MTTPEMAREVEELRKDCAGYADKLERIKSATNHVTPEEKEKVKRGWALYHSTCPSPEPSRGTVHVPVRAVSCSCCLKPLWP